MPTYEYECQKCGHVFDVFQSMTEERIKRCPKCRGKVIRLFGTGSGIIFKGSGFYETDYRRSKASSTSGKEATASESSSSDKAPSSESTADKSKPKKPESTSPSSKD